MYSGSTTVQGFLVLGISAFRYGSPKWRSSESFLEKLSIGVVVGTRRVAEYLSNHGHAAVELERYTTSNKIWSVKVKRLRVPDLVCLRCGVRVEARGKTKLEVKLSDSPTVAGREWDAGLRDRDLVALVRCEVADDDISASDRVALFSTGALRATVQASRLGPPKSAAEGAERDRTWPATVPVRGGRVREVTERFVRVTWDDGRAYSYRRSEAKPYLYLGTEDRFGAGDTLLMGVVPGLEDPSCPGEAWDPRTDIRSPNLLDAYVGVKALGAVGSEDDLALIRSIAESTADERIVLEAMGSLARLGDDNAVEKLAARITDPDEALDMKMEAVLILSELGSAGAAEALGEIASNRDLHEEIRAAAVWGHGMLEPASREPLLAFLGDENDLVAVHASVALGTDLPEHLLDRLQEMLRGPDRESASATRILVSQGAHGLQRLMMAASRKTGRSRDWAIYGLAAAGEEAVKAGLGEESARDLEPILGPFWLGVESWIARPETAALLRFVQRQHL